MNQIIFKNMTRSEIMTELMREQMDRLRAKFPKILNGRTYRAEIEVENTIQKPGADVFRLKLVITLGKRGALVLHQKGSHAYEVLWSTLDAFENKLRKLSKRDQMKKRLKLAYSST
jgi:ribosome-associated translation inhibitor RaiA